MRYVLLELKDTFGREYTGNSYADAILYYAGDSFEALYKVITLAEKNIKKALKVKKVSIGMGDARKDISKTVGNKVEASRSIPVTVTDKSGEQTEIESLFLKVELDDYTKDKIKVSLGVIPNGKMYSFEVDNKSPEGVNEQIAEFITKISDDIINAIQQEVSKEIKK